MIIRFLIITSGQFFSQWFVAGYIGNRDFSLQRAVAYRLFAAAWFSLVLITTFFFFDSHGF